MNEEQTQETQMNNNEQVAAFMNEFQNQRSQQESAGSLHGNRSLQQYQNSIVEWQLDLSREFELIHHQLRGHVIKRDDKGNEYWAEPDDPEQKLLNEKGAQEVEKVIRNYLNKNTLLSNFTNELIMKRVGEFAHRLRRFIYLSYEEFGLDNYYRQKHFEMLVMNVVDMIEAAYYRAMNGLERESLTTIRSIIQQETVDNSQMSKFQPIQQQGGSKLNPFNWFK
jgi:hypothetical protein